MWLCEFCSRSFLCVILKKLFEAIETKIVWDCLFLWLSVNLKKTNKECVENCIFFFFFTSSLRVQARIVLTNSDFFWWWRWKLRTNLVYDYFVLGFFFFFLVSKMVATELKSNEFREKWSWDSVEIAAFSFRIRFESNSDYASPLVFQEEDSEYFFFWFTVAKWLSYGKNPLFPNSTLLIIIELVLILFFSLIYGFVFFLWQRV